MAETKKPIDDLVGDEENNAYLGDETTVKKKAAFVAALAEYGAVGNAAKVVGIHRATVYKWKEADPLFARDVDAAIDDAMDDVEVSLIKRGKDKDTIAAIFMLKGHRPEKYADRVKADVNHTGAAPIATPAEREERLRSLGIHRGPH